MAEIPPPENPVLLLRQLLRSDFCAFMRKAWPYITGGEDIAWNWHFEAMAYELARIERGDHLRLLVTIPPRNGKSKTISVIWVAWMLGQDPARNFVCVSYSNELSAKLARDCLAITQSHWYRELFPRTVISQKRSAAFDFETTAGGGRLATSVTGTLTGRGGDTIILDDVIKPEEANSETTRNAVNDWYQSTLASRLNDKRSGAIICVMQRLHQFDLAGMLIESGEWRELRLPAIATEDEVVPLTRGRFHRRQPGDVLHPEREPRHVLDSLRAAMGSVAFSAQYQQDPVPEAGNMIQAEWLKVYDPAKLQFKPGEIVQSWDTASKHNPHNDYSVCVTALVRRRYVFILDVFRARLQFPKLKAATIRLAREHDADALLVEDQSSGSQLIQTLRSENPQGVPQPIKCKPEGDKIARVAGISAMLEAGQLHLPADAPWLTDFKSELLGFPSTRFDDQVDALSQLLTWVRTRLARQPSAIGAPIFFHVDDRGFIHQTGGDVYGGQTNEQDDDGEGGFFNDNEEDIDPFF